MQLTYKNILKNILYVPLASLILVVISCSFFMSFVTIKLKEMGTAETIIGYIHSAYYVGMMLGAIKGKNLINRIGYIRANSSFLSIITISVLLQQLVQCHIVWMICRFLFGFAMSGCYIIIESWLLTDEANIKKQGQAFAIYMICLYFGQSVSQFLLDILDLKTATPFLVTAIIACLAIIPYSLTYKLQPHIDQTCNDLSIRGYYSIAPLGFIGCLISGLIISAIYGFFPIYAQDHALSVSYMLAITIGGGFCLQWSVGKISDVMDKATLLALLSLANILASSLILIPYISNIFIYISCFFLGGFCFSIYPVSVTQVCNYFQKTEAINITGFLLLVYCIGSMVGSIIIAFLIECYSSLAIFYYIIALSVVFGACSLRTAFKK